MTDAFPHLISPGQIGSLTLQSRIFMTAMGSDLVDGDGMGGERMAAYYAARARGGAGLVITEAVAVGYPYGFLRPNVLALSAHTLTYGGTSGLVRLPVKELPINSHWFFVWSKSKRQTVIADQFLQYVQGEGRELLYKELNLNTVGNKKNKKA